MGITTGDIYGFHAAVYGAGGAKRHAACAGAALTIIRQATTNRRTTLLRRLSRLRTRPTRTPVLQARQVRRGANRFDDNLTVVVN